MKSPPREGMLYKVITTHGETFTIYYGYYDEKDKTGKYTEPIPIFPDFQKNPTYTKDGHPFVTYMQDVCRHYAGELKNDSCYSCKHFVQGEDLIGICRCAENKKDA